jgi:hypothetical protein
MATKTRSPNYPFLPLEQAVQRARLVWDKEGRHAAAPETIVGHWGYASKSSGGRQTIGALRHYGLLEGRGQVQLTGLAQAILFSEEGSPEWLRRIQEAALNPAIHKEIWTKYDGELPSDQNLRYYLVVERGFAESGAAELIAELRATAAYARLSEATDSLSFDEGDNSEDTDEMEATLENETLTPSGRRRQVQLPYSATDWAVLQASFPLKGDEWDQMIAVLTAMKPALTDPGD